MDKTTKNTANKSLPMLSLVFLLCLRHLLSTSNQLALPSVCAHESIRACGKDRRLDVGLNSDVLNRLLVTRLLLLLTHKQSKRSQTSLTVNDSKYQDLPDARSQDWLETRRTNRRENRKENNVYLLCFFFLF